MEEAFDLVKDATSLPPAQPPQESSSVPTTSAALQITEILLLIFSNLLPDYAPPDLGSSSLARAARVSKNWLGPARSVLYSTLDITWRFSEADRLMAAFEVNSSLFSLVDSVRLRGFSEEDLEREVWDGCRDLRIEHFSQADYDELYSHPGPWDYQEDYDPSPHELGTAGCSKELRENVDNKWFNEGRGEADFTLVDFLRHLSKLRHLVFTNFLGPNQSSFSTRLVWVDANAVFARLQTFRAEHSKGWVVQQILSGTHHLASLYLEEVSLELSPPPLPFLLHLSFSGNGTSYRMDAPLNFATFAPSLETLYIYHVSVRDHIIFESLKSSARLSHIHFAHLSIREVANFSAGEEPSFVAYPPNLRYLSGSYLDTFIPSLPPTVCTLIHNNWQNFSRVPTLVPSGSFGALKPMKVGERRDYLSDCLGKIDHLPNLRVYQPVLFGRGGAEGLEDLIDDARVRLGIEVRVEGPSDDLGMMAHWKRELKGRVEDEAR